MPVDTSKTRSPSLAATAAAPVLTLSLLLSACAPHDSGQVPQRAPEMPSLVRAGTLDPAAFGGRNDPTLGLDRHPIIRTPVQASETTVDRQRVIDGRSYQDFRVTNRTRESLRR
jgi:hypothetical protein